MSSPVALSTQSMNPPEIIIIHLSGWVICYLRIAHGRAIARQRRQQAERVAAPSTPGQRPRFRVTGGRAVVADRIADIRRHPARTAAGDDHPTGFLMLPSSGRTCFEVTWSALLIRQ